MKVEERARWRAQEESHSVRLRSGCRKQSLSLDGPPCRDLMLPPVPPVPISRGGRTVIFDIVEYVRVYYNGMDNAEWKPNMQDMQESAYPKKKKKSVAGQFAAVKYKSETYWWTQKLSREDYGVHKWLGIFFF